MAKKMKKSKKVIGKAKPAKAKSKSVEKGLVEMVAILDRSGSMADKMEDLIGGINEILEQQRSEGKRTVTMASFDNHYELIYDGVDINDVKPLDKTTIFPRGSTALLDAVGKTIHTIKNRLDSRKTGLPEKIMVMITTDGLENASCEYTKEKVKSLVTELEKENWEFIFLGANMDSFSEAGHLGMDMSRAANFQNNARGMRNAVRAYSSAVTSRSNGVDYCMSSLVAEEEKKDDQS